MQMGNESLVNIKVHKFKMGKGISRDVNNTAVRMVSWFHEGKDEADRRIGLYIDWI